MIVLVYGALVALIGGLAAAGYRNGKPAAPTNTHTLDAWKAQQAQQQ